MGLVTVSRLRRVGVVVATSTAMVVAGAGMGSAYAASTSSTTASTASSSAAANTHKVDCTSSPSDPRCAPQPLSTADKNTGGANGKCSGTTATNGIYCSTRSGLPSGNGNQSQGGHTGEPCAGCVGKADNKNPPGQEKTNPYGTFPNNGYECDRNNGIGKTNPAHTGCPPTLTGSCVTAASGSTVTWLLSNTAGTPVDATWTSGSQTGSVTIPAATKTGPGTATFTTSGTSVKVSFPGTSFAEIDKSVTCSTPSTPLQPLTLASSCSGTSVVWTVSNPNATDVVATWSAGAASGQVTVPGTGSTTLPTSATSVSITFSDGTKTVTVGPESAGGCPPGTSKLNPLTLHVSCDTAKTGSFDWTLTNPNATDVVGHWATATQHGDVTAPANGTSTPFVTTSSDVTVSFDAASGLSALTPGASIPDCSDHQVTQTLAGHIYDCTGGTATTTEVTGGTIAVSGGQTTVATVANPLNPTPVAADTYTLTGTAPSGWLFVTCRHNSSKHPNQTRVKVPAGGAGVGKLYVARVPSGSNCSENSFFLGQSPASGATVHSGDTLSVYYADETALGTGAFAPVLTVDGVVQPASALTVTPTTNPSAPKDENKFIDLLSYTTAADLGTGTHTFAIKAFDSDQNKPGGDCGVATWTLTVAPPVTQTLSGVIELCDTTMAPSAGSELAIEGTAVTSGNPLGLTSVPAGEHTVDATAPTGYHFTTCHNTTQNVLTPTTAKETVTVPAGGTAAAVFFVAATPPSTSAVAPDLAIVKTASAANVHPGDPLTYTLLVTNVGTGPTTGAVTVTDAVPSGLGVVSVDGGTAWSCTAGQDVTCTYTGGAIGVGASIPAITVTTTVLGRTVGTVVNTGVVATPGDTNLANNTSTVRTPVIAVEGEKIPKTPKTPQTPQVAPQSQPKTPPKTPPATVLPFTGSNAGQLVPAALLMLTVGGVLLVSGRRRRTT